MHFSEAPISVAFQSIFMKWRLLSEKSVVRKELNDLYTRLIIILSLQSVLLLGRNQEW